MLGALPRLKNFNIFLGPHLVIVLVVAHGAFLNETTLNNENAKKKCISDVFK
jgi:hypothetical protein